MKKEGSFPLILFIAIVLTVSVSFNVQADITDPNWAPTLTVPIDSSIELCADDEFCFTVSGEDVDANDSLTLSLVSGPISFDPVTFGTSFDTLICFTPEQTGDYTFEWLLTDRQNHQVTKSFTATVTVRPVPVIADQNFSVEFCAWESIRSLLIQYDDIPGSNMTLTLLSGEGSLESGALNYSPTGSSTYTFVVELANECGADTATITDEITLNLRPELYLSDTTVYICAADETCIDLVGFDPEAGPITIELVEGPGTFNMTTDSSGTLCFTPDNVNEATYQFVYCLTDICPLEGGGGPDVEATPICYQDTVNVTVIINQAPQIVCLSPQVFFTCEVDTFCFDMIANDPELDPVTFEILSGNASVEGSTICVISGESDPFDVIIAAVDSCGNADTCTVSVEVKGNRAPYVNMADNFEVSPCGPEQICFTASAGDLDLNIATTELSFGSYNPNDDRICFEADTAGLYEIRMIVTDSCGAADTGFTYVTVNMNQPPLVDLGIDQSLMLCGVSEVCLDLTINDNNIETVTPNIGNYNVQTSQLCFTPDTAGHYEVILTVEDDCGAIGIDTAYVDVSFGEEPFVNLGQDLLVSLCQPEEICVDLATIPVYQSLDISMGAFNEETKQICFTPETAGSYSLIVSVTDSCGATASDTVMVEVDLNVAPEVLIADTTVYLCQAGPICLPFTASDADGNLMSVTSNRGTIDENGICFVPYAQGDYQIILTALDSCGVSTQKSATIHVKTDQSLNVILPNDTTLFACATDTFCLPVTGIPDGAEVEVTGINTWFNAENQTVCFYSDCSNQNRITVNVTTACGTYSSEFTVDVDCNSKPLVLLPPDTAFYACDAAEICLPVGISDIDGNLADILVSGGFYDESTSKICFTADTAGIYTISVTATDACGAISTDLVNVTVDLNSPPVCNVPDDQTIATCGQAEIALPVSATDVDGNLVSCEVIDGPGEIMHGVWLYDPVGSEEVTVTVRCIDECGAICESSFTITFDGNLPPTASCLADTTVLRCDLSEFCLPGFSGSDVDGNYDYSYLIDGYIDEAGNACFIPVEGLNELRFVAVDSCGLEDTCTARVTIVLNSAPVCEVPNDTTIFQCEPTAVLLPVGATDVNLAYCEIIDGPGELVDGYWSYTPSGAEIVTVTVRCTDHCLASCESSFTINFEMNRAPVVNCIADTTLFLCELEEVCLPGFSAYDDDGNLASVTVNTGTYNDDGTICFTPVEGENIITLSAVDSCGLIVSFCETTVTVILNSAPVCEVPNDTTIKLCEPTLVSLPVSASDVDANLGGEIICSIIDGPGELVDGFWVYTPTNSEIVAVTVHCEDSCGAYCESTFEVTFDVNIAPVASCPGDTTIFSCYLDEICLTGFSTEDTDGNYSHSFAIGGNLNESGELCFIPQAGLNELKYVAVDSCGLADTCTINVTIIENSAPICQMPDNPIINLCEITQIMLPVITTDADNNIAICEIISGPGELIDGNWVYTPTGDETVEVTIRCTDHCLAVCEGTFTVTINISDPPVVDLGGDQNLFLCELSEVCIDVTTIDNYESLTTNLGLFNDGSVCFTPEGEGAYELIVEVIDSCGLIGADSIDINITLNHAPEITSMSDTSLYLCSPTQVCLPVEISDLDDNIASITTNRGSYADGEICFVPYGAGDYRVIVTVTDDCGLSDVDTVMVTVKTDQAVSLIVPNDTTIFTCDLDTFCFPIGGIPDNGTVTVSGVNTWFDAESENVCFYVQCGVTNRIVVNVATPCGNYSEDFTVKIVCNSPPQVALLPDTVITICEPGQICLPVGVTDRDGNLSSIDVSGATFNPILGSVCFEATEPGTRTIIVTATDACGDITTDQVVVTVVMNVAPEISFGIDDTTLTQCAPEEICIPLNVSDQNGNLDKVFVSRGIYNAETGMLCFTRDTAGTYCLTAIARDLCGLTDTTNVCITFLPGDFVTIECPLDPMVVDTICKPGVVCLPLVISGAEYSVTTSIGGYSNGQICFQADSSGLYSIQVIASAACNVDTCNLEVEINIAEPVTITCPPDQTEFLCGVDTLCYEFTASSSVSFVHVTAPAFVRDNQICLPVSESGSFELMVTGVGSCGADSCSFTVDAVVNSAPIVTLASDTNMIVCDLSEICIPFDTSDVDGNITSLSTSLGVIRDGFVCFTPNTYGAYSITVGATDECGARSSKTILVFVSRGSDAAIICPTNKTVTICGADSVCVAAPVSPFDAEITVLPNGHYDKTTGSVCVYVSESGTYPITLIAAAACSTDTCQFDLTVVVAEPPLVSCPSEIDTLMCVSSPTDLCFPIEVSGTDVTVAVKPAGTYSAGEVCIPINADGTYEFDIIATGTCGVDTCSTVINVTADEAPILTLPSDVTIDWCSYDSITYCFDGIYATDDESDAILSITCGPSSLDLAVGRNDSGQVCFMPEEPGNYEFCFEADDGCQVTSGSFFVNVVEKDDCDVCVRLEIDGGDCTPVGLSKKVDINIETNRAIGGFEVLISYDASVLSFQDARISNSEINGWEYFVYRLNSASCGSSCPSGLVRFIGIADVNNGDNHPPAGSLEPQGLFIETFFLIANDQNLSDQFVPIRFAWYSCADNAFSDPTGNDLYMDLRVYNLENNLIWDEEDELNYPEGARIFGLGAPDSCAEGSDKAAPIRCIEFFDGGICIIHADSIDARGDVNLNEIPYEIADVVVFTNYFIYGLSAFTINVPGQIAATDVNADGLTLSVADLVYLIRVVIGDADPIPKMTQYSEDLILTTEQTTDHFEIKANSIAGIGGALLIYEFEGDLSISDPELAENAAEMSMASIIDGNQLRVLMYNIGRDRIKAGEASILEIPFNGNGTLSLVKAEIVDYQGQPYQVVEKQTALPSNFALNQNYPNPFNPTTTISFDLPVQTNWTLTVYNIAGAVVRRFNGDDPASTVTLEWDGREANGAQVASGVYFYRLDADSFNQTRKMIMLK